MKSYNISRFEETGDSLFIAINSTNNPVYLEHFFTEEEKLDIEETITRLVAELEIKDSEYVAPSVPVSRLKEVENFMVDEEKVALAKTEILAEKAEAEKVVVV